MSLFRPFQLLRNQLSVPEIVYHLSYTCTDFPGEEVWVGIRFLPKGARPHSKVKNQWSKPTMSLCIWKTWGLSKRLFQDYNLWPEILFLPLTGDWLWWAVISAISSSPCLTARAATLFTDLNISSYPWATVGPSTPPAGTGPFILPTRPRNDLAGWVSVQASMWGTVCSLRGSLLWIQEYFQIKGDGQGGRNNLFLRIKILSHYLVHCCVRYTYIGWNNCFGENATTFKTPWDADFRNFKMWEKKACLSFWNNRLTICTEYLCLCVLEIEVCGFSAFWELGCQHVPSQLVAPVLASPAH